MARCGDVKISRDTYESDPFWREERTFSRWEAWHDLIQMASCEDRQEMTGKALVDVRRGELLASERLLARRWGWSTTKVRSFLALLTEMGRLEKRGETRKGSVYLVVDYDTYVPRESAEEAEEKRTAKREKSGERSVISIVSAYAKSAEEARDKAEDEAGMVAEAEKKRSKKREKSAKGVVALGLFSDEEALSGPEGDAQRKEEEKRKVGQKKKEEEKKLTPPYDPPPGGDREERERELFSAFWGAYPKRAGSNPKQAAFRAWKKRRQEGAKPEEIMAGLERYRAYLEATDKVGTEYVMMASTFLGPNRRWEDAYEIPSAPKKKESTAGKPWYLLDPSSDEYLEAFDAEMRRSREIIEQRLRERRLATQQRSSAQQVMA